MSKNLMFLVVFALVIGMINISTAELVGHWRFDEGPGDTANDASGNGNQGALQGNPQWVAGKIGGALDFNGSSDHVTIPFSESLNLLNQGDFTISAWFKADEIPSENKEVFQQGDSNGTGRTWLFIHKSNEIRSFLGGAAVLSGIGIEAQTWYHTAIVVIEGGDKDIIQIYINGEPAGVPEEISIEDSEGMYFIGCHKNLTNFWDGLIDDVRLYNHAQTQVEIQASMQGERYPYALGPEPADGDMFEDTWAILSWSPGAFALSHDVYIGDNFDDVNTGAEGTFQGNQTTTTFDVGLPGGPYPDGLVPCTTYYWRIDEVNGTDTYKGGIWSFSIISACEIHVSKMGSDSASGSHDQPYLTINKAASIALPGDTVTIHAGTYREWVKPIRGGIDESKRITYRAAPGEEVFIKGSERINSWTRESGNVWKVELQNSFFGDYNPYALHISGDFLKYGKWHHLGDVYLNGEAFYGKGTQQEVKENLYSWFCQVDEHVTTIWANFGNANPNDELTEINVRESLFMPEITGLRYITVDGLNFMHAATNWMPSTLKLQMGAVGPRMGKHWIIENCTITNARCVGIILGYAPGVNYNNIDAYGDHIIRNNIIWRCGQAGIFGTRGATRSLITGNLIEDTNYRREFGGWETAGLKFLMCVDTIVSGNLIRGVFRQTHGAYGIWVDWANQGIRITGNVVYNTEAATVFLEMNHGPILVDNNILIGQPIRSNSEATVFAHNLFVDCGYDYRPDTERSSAYFRPHTTRIVGSKTGTTQDDKWYNNIFIRQGLDQVKTASGYVSDYNVFLEGANKSSFGDENSIVDSYATGLTIRDYSLGTTITFSINDAPFRLNGPLVTAELVGIFPTVGQTIEDRYGHPINVDTDFNGRKYSQPIAGPLSDLKEGINMIIWPYDLFPEDPNLVDPNNGDAEIICAEGFETGDFSKFSWRHSGEQSWDTTRSERHSGFFSARSGSIEDFESTTLQFSIDCVSGDITFYFKVSSEPRHDNLKFKIDGAEKGVWSGEEDWTEVSFAVDEGTRTFEWTYSKDSSDSEGDDTAWIDDIVFPVE